MPDDELLHPESYEKELLGIRGHWWRTLSCMLNHALHSAAMHKPSLTALDGADGSSSRSGIAKDL